ncbi:hypothetical protein [Myxococcus qinghaiensis]|uniref:hypothetical protein n=1 Tax=Myxococcus qinghaiensis TaxID=2906758 RepID=UPI0020A75C3C|nr:hypothetical protein [Myxococcus qinghaiensis]MCP3165872.1 hypothetical protein [Myxococcus qinghaiensis]
MSSVIEGDRTNTSGFYNQGQSQSASSGGGEGDIKQEGKEQVKRLGGMTRQRAFSRVDAKKGALVEGLEDLVQEMESIAGQGDGSKFPQQLVGSAVGFVRRTSDTLNRNSTEDLIQQAKTRMKERPGMALAACAVLGFVAARFLKD